MSRPPKLAEIFDREATDWDAAHGPDSPRAQDFAARAAYLRELCGVLGRPRVIDLGCGTGRQLIDLADRIETGVGLDISSGMIARAQRNAARSDASNIEFRTGAIESAVPADSGGFDLAMFVGSLEHAPEPARQLAAAARLLEEGGRLVVIMPHPFNPGVILARASRAARVGAPFRHFTPRQLAILAAQTRFRLESVHGIPYGAAGSILGGVSRRWPIVAGAYAARFALA